MMHRSLNLKNSLICSIPLLFFFNEYLIYYLVLFNCSWPNEEQTKILILSDTHLLGVRNGHWFDKLRREWQMYMSFQTALTLHKPHAVFFLGDLFDEGEISNDDQFKKYSNRFNELFYVPDDVRRFTVVGNHDIGFHYMIGPRNLDRFSRQFGLDKGIEHIELNGNHFILINSMAMEGDNCAFCSKAVRELEKISTEFQCSLDKSTTCGLKTPYSRPILMQHFPLFRLSDMECLDTEDLAPGSIRMDKFREKWECLSENSTKLLLEKLRPRAVFGGHVHYGCQKWWEAPYNFWEYTISSFSWRNNQHPSFLLVSVSPQEINVNRCFLPHELSVIYVYGVFSTIWSLCLLFFVARKCAFLKTYKLKLRPSKPERLIY